MLAQAAEAPQATEPPPAEAAAAAATTAADADPAPASTTPSSSAAAARPPRSSSGSSSQRRPPAYGRVAGTLLQRPPVRVSAGADRTKLAAYLVRLLEAEPGQTLLLTAVGGDAISVALSAVAKLQDMLPEWTALEGRRVTWRAALLNRALSFAPREAAAPAAAAAGAAEAGGEDSGAAAGGEEAAAAGPASEGAAGGKNLFGVFVSLRPADQFALTEEQASTSAPMKLRSRGTRRRDGEQQEEEEQPQPGEDARLQRSREQEARITAHIVRNIRAGRPALLELQSPGLGLKSKTLLRLLISASQQLSRDKADFRFSCTLSRELFDSPRPASPAAAAADGAAAAAGESNGSDDDEGQEQPAGAAEAANGRDTAPAAGARPWSKQVRIVVTCHPSAVPGREGAGAAGGRGERRSERPARRVREGRDGMVEVPLEEWAQLKEQLEVVPALTEQLQIMTRQHEQLLSLLAQHGQQQQQ